MFRQTKRKMIFKALFSRCTQKSGRLTNGFVRRFFIGNNIAQNFIAKVAWASRRVTTM